MHLSRGRIKPATGLCVPPPCPRCVMYTAVQKGKNCSRSKTIHSQIRYCSAACVHKIQSYSGFFLFHKLTNSLLQRRSLGSPSSLPPAFFRGPFPWLAGVVSLRAGGRLRNEPTELVYVQLNFAVVSCIQS